MVGEPARLVHTDGSSAPDPSAIDPQPAPPCDAHRHNCRCLRQRLQPKPCLAKSVRRRLRIEGSLVRPSRFHGVQQTDRQCNGESPPTPWSAIEEQRSELRYNSRMNLQRVALANLPIPINPQHSVDLAQRAIAEAAV